MRRLNAFICWMLLLTTPPFFVYPHVTPPIDAFHVQKVSYEEGGAASDYVLSYDDILQVLDAIESGELEEKCSLEGLERVKHFVAFLAKEGALPDDSEESLSLQEDLEELLNGEETLYRNAISFVSPDECQYMIVPAVLSGHYDVVLCKGWVSKHWKKLRKFAKKHRKALIIGAVIVVAVAVVVVAVAAASAPAVGTAVASAAGGAAVDVDKGKNAEHSQEPAILAEAQEAPILKSAIDEQVASFKENLIQQQFFEPTSLANPNLTLSLEENGRALGSAFGHNSLSNVEQQISSCPRLAQEVQEVNAKYLFTLPGEGAGHGEVDRKFSTDYTQIYLNLGTATDLNTFSYQVRGESALNHGCYHQAVHDLSKVIAANPNHPILYLERGMAHLGLGQYERSLEDYHEFASQTQEAYPLSVPEFSLGFAKGLPRGIYDSGSGLFLLVSDLATQPVNTGKQMWSALSHLSELACTEQWDALSEAIAPEVHQLVTEWGSLPSETRGELAGYAFGK
ncbi:MAG: hypothetical protein JSR80_01660, partial [Verrucomicrobia bacterium]|nr:hypothetical protein [Verrucomicrobiota bacterium]